MFKRLFLPIAGITVLALAVLTWTAIHYSSIYWEAEARRTLARVADVIGNDPVLLRPGALVKIRRLIEAEILIYDYQGRLFAGTPAVNNKSIPFLPNLSKELLEKLFQEGVLIVPVQAKGLPPSRQVFRVLNLASKEVVILSLVVSDQDRINFVRQIAWAVGITAISCLLFLWACIYNLTRNVTDPLDELLKAISKVKEGRLDVEAPEKGPPEIVTVARAFNRLVLRLSEYKRLVQEAEREATAGAMAAELAHEIRNPLTSLKMAGQLLCQVLKDREKELKRAEAIVRETRRLERIVSELLDRSRGSLHKSRFDLNSLVKRVAELSEPEIAEKGLRVQLDLSSDLPSLMADEEKIEQIMWNLLRNAKDVMQPGGTIYVKTRLLHVPHEMVCLIVEDQGPGLDEEALEKAFKPFFTTKKKGMGLGLAICREIAIRHGGELTLENRLEGGARARLCLPVETKAST